jgi:hypothetical protein
MSPWIKVAVEEEAATINTLREAGLEQGTAFKIYRPGYNSIVTGKQRLGLEFILLMFFDPKQQFLAKLVL